MADQVTSLRSLSPEFQPDQHGEYVRILMTELQRAGQNVARNIALTGHYGSGKSSVLTEVQRQLEVEAVKVINLSLPSLGIGDARLETPGDKTTLNTTNLIQKEIVKQLLYRQRPSEAPASRYNRLDVFQLRQARQRAAGAAAGVTAVALLAQVPSRLRDSFPNAFWGWLERHLAGWFPTSLQWLSLAAVFILAFGAVVWAQRLFHQRLRVTELAAGPAKVTLSENSTSFFDEYLDEIVYFFQNSATTVVVFEDLDRFEDPHIFETLRELNLLLNNAEQTGSEPIRFLYAIRDSIFEQLDEDDNPVASASIEGPAALGSETRRLMSTNRTKFFDLVVPVVPFISHRTSRELIRGQLSTVEDDQRPSAAVLDLVSAHLTDMRLIKNICNEYDVFRPRILGAAGLEGLTPDRLFASIVYKNVYMGDYEKIRNAESLLDDLYKAFRDWVSQRAAAAREVERVARVRLGRVSMSALNARSQRLGERLQAVLAARGLRTVNPAHSQVIVGGLQYPWVQLSKVEFWKAYVSGKQDLSVIYHPGFGVEGGSLSFENVQTLMNERLSVSDWEAADRTEQRNKMVAAAKEQRVVAQASLTNALGETTMDFQYGSEQLSLADVASQLFEGAGMARELLSAGYIDENFALYVTQFPGQGSAAAMNFILKAVQPNVMDIEYQFSADDNSRVEDIEAVLQSEGPRVLQGQSVYNVKIFDHLLASDSDKLDEPIRRLAANAEADRRFIEAYLSAGKMKFAFVERLSAAWPGLLSLLIGDDLEGRGLELLDAAIRGADPRETYELADGKREALTAALQRLDVVASPLTDQMASSVARVFEQLDVRAADIATVVEPLRSEMVARKLYDITRSNLTTILGEGQLSLDTIKADTDEIYQYMLDHLPQYLDALAEPDSEATVRDAGRFGEVLADVASNDPEALKSVAAGAVDGCLLDDLSSLEPHYWSDVACAHRLRLTVPLVTQYEAELGLDNAMADYLTATRSFDISEGESGRLELALSVLNDRALDDDTKMALLRSLRLARESVDASALAPNAHPLIPVLVRGRWIADNENAFSSLGEDEWPTKKALVQVSANFTSYMNALTLTANDVRDLASPGTPDAVKEVLLRDYATFEPRVGTNGARALASWIATKGPQPDPRILVSLATKGQAPAAVPIIKLLGAQAPTIDRASLLASLNALGDPYDQLTSPGRGRKKVPNHPGMGAVLSRLQRERIVSTYDEKTSKSRFEVSKRLS